LAIVESERCFWEEEFEKSWISGNPALISHSATGRIPQILCQLLEHGLDHRLFSDFIHDWGVRLLKKMSER
jgi:hypothetical protein